MKKVVCFLLRFCLGLKFGCFFLLLNRDSNLGASAITASAIIPVSKTSKSVVTYHVRIRCAPGGDFSRKKSMETGLSSKCYLAFENIYVYVSLNYV